MSATASIAGGSTFSTSLDFLLPRILDVGREVADLGGWRTGGYLHIEKQRDIYVAWWAERPGSTRCATGMGANVGAAMRSLLVELSFMRGNLVAEEGSDGR